ncbi:uncharacterized protein E5676_scaffold606G00870 [Cucumis melo var. makuwa]|uniref:Uncharacterized protein n=1 Tax=Cucumis melo var. makuwa TaxID=1194695 RepID=A0A5A7VBG8_CUCMM|nr:uncharacterized protein E6C27_scaffold90G00830 [Cucumis melo var. makuwa]TYK07201.1 uncharacterized protein E5676_scaffold606G00870 [Cucumis melo var. makuwa]
MPKQKRGKQINEGQTSHYVPENFSSESDEDNVPISKRKLFETVFKGKGKESAAENVSKKRKFEKDVRASEQKKMKKSDKKEAVEKHNK